MGPKVKTLGHVNPLKSATEGNWLLASSPQLLRYQESAKVSADIQLAIDNYDALADSSVDAQTRTEAQRRAAYLRVRMAEAQAAESDDQRFSVAITHLNELLQQHPDDPNRDLTLYQLARAYQASGDSAQAAASLRSLAQQEITPELREDVLFRLAELEFQQGNYGLASGHYRGVLASGSDSAFFSMAQYKLGWSEFRLSRFDAAIDVFSDMLESKLPARLDFSDLKAVESAAATQDPWLGDALRVSSLSLAALGGASAFAHHYGRAQQEPRYAPLLYTALASLYQDKRMFSSAAQTFAMFAQRHPEHPLAPYFDHKPIAIYQRAGFIEDAISSMSAYAVRYAPDAAYWQEQIPDVAVQNHVQEYVTLLSTHFHAQAQAEPTAAVQHYKQAKNWYLRKLQWFANDPKAPETHLLLAETLQALQQPQLAIQHFLHAAYDYPGYARAAEAAYAAVLGSAAMAADTNLSTAARQAARTQETQLSLRFADTFPQHPHWVAVLIRATEHLASQENWSAATTQAQRVLQVASLDTPERMAATAVLADAQFAQKLYPAAEQAYLALMAMTPIEQRGSVAELLALSIYRQAEQAQSQGLTRLAVDHFLRIGQVTPRSSFRSQADFDAAAALISLNAHQAAEPVLEGLIWRDPEHKLASEARRKLAAVYQHNGKLAAAATSYAGISNDARVSDDLRRAAAWRSAELYDKAQTVEKAFSAYADYVRRYPEPLEHALKARQRLARFSLDQQGDLGDYSHWLQELVAAEQAAGNARSTQSRVQAAQAALELGRLESARASGIKLKPPLERSLLERKAQMERAIGWLQQAADGGFSDITPAALFSIGVSYGSFAHALLNAPRPRGLSALEAEEFGFLLEDQAFPFEELAINLHEQNLNFLKDGIWNVWIERSTQALAELLPAKYAKREQLVQRYDAIH